MSIGYLFIDLFLLIVACAVCVLLKEFFLFGTKICCRTNTVTPTTTVVVQTNGPISIVIEQPQLTTCKWEGTEDTMCVICQCNLQQDENCCKLKCGHNYHEKCINQLLKTGQKCPLCRKQIY